MIYYHMSIKTIFESNRTQTQINLYETKFELNSLVKLNKLSANLILVLFYL